MHHHYHQLTGITVYLFRIAFAAHVRCPCCWPCQSVKHWTIEMVIRWATKHATECTRHCEHGYYNLGNCHKVLHKSCNHMTIYAGVHLSLLCCTQDCLWCCGHARHQLPVAQWQMQQFTSSMPTTGCTFSCMFGHSHVQCWCAFLKVTAKPLND